MKNKFTSPAFFAVIITFLICSTSNTIYAQNTEVKENTLEIKGAFFGNWKDMKDPNHLLDIYKEGTLIIVQTRAEAKDGTKGKKYSVVYNKGNRIMVDIGNGSTPMTITDDGTKISFLGNDYMKK